MAYPTPTPIPTPFPLETPQEIELSKNYRLTELQHIHVKDICIYINEIDGSFLPIDCSDIFPLNSAFGFLYDIIDHTNCILERNRIYTQNLNIIQNSITETDDQYEKRKIIYRYFDLLRDLDLRIIYIFSNFHHIVDKIKDYEYHILYRQLFEKNTFQLWLLSCNRNTLTNSPIQKDIALRTNLLSDDQLNRIYQKSSYYTYMEREENKGKFKIFTSYSHKDKESHKVLEGLLDIKINNRAAVIWNDNHIKPGEEWDKKIKGQLYASDIVVFLISEEFLNSEYINRVEIKTTLERYENGEVIILPIILSKCKYNESPLGKFEALPEKALPINNWNNSTLGWLDAIKKIDEIISEKLEISAIIAQESTNNINITQSGEHNINTGLNNGTQNIKLV